MSAKPRISSLATQAVVSLAFLAAVPAAAIEPVVGSDEVVEARVDGDLNGDGIADLAYVVGTDDWRELRVALSGSGGRVEGLDLGTDALGTGSLAIERNVLKFDDLTGGTTAYASTRRFRYDALRKRMRLIGLDVTLYSRTFAHDGFEMSWNLLTGDTITHELRLTRRGDAAYDKVRERRLMRIEPVYWLAESPDPETALEEIGRD